MNLGAIEMQRDKVAAEIILRESIRKIITALEGKRRTKMIAEHSIRSAIRSILLEKTAVPDAVPHESTAANVLDDFINDTMKNLKRGYQKNTTNYEQRESYEAHILNAMVNTLAVADSQDDSDEDLEEEINVKVDNAEDDDKMIGNFEPEEEEEEDPRQAFAKGLEDFSKDNTGRNIAYDVYSRGVEQKLLDSYEILDNPKDKEIFKQYLITNVKLYFDKFEDELRNKLPNITTPEYEKIKDEGDQDEVTPEDENEEEVIES